jgi:hypothetical protein
MANNSWRRKVDPMIREHLEAQIKESYKERKAFRGSKEPSRAQLWIAIAGLSKQIFDLNLKVKFLERALQDALGRSKEKESNEDVKKVMDALRKY